MDSIHSNITVSVTELKRNFANVLATAKDAPVAVLNHNKPEAYLLSAKHYEEILGILEDLDFPPDVFDGDDLRGLFDVPAKF